MSVGTWGDSLTAPTTSYAYLVRDWVKTHYPKYDITWTAQARSGNWPWSNLVRYPAELRAASPEIILCDVRPTDAAGREMKSCEALIRRIFTDTPGARMLSPIFPACSDPSDDGSILDKDAIALAGEALATHYGIPLIDYRQAVIDLVAGGASLSTYMADTVHPTTAGQELCAQLIEAYIIANPSFVTAPASRGALPARLHDDGGYEREPTRILGTGYTAISGTGWSTTGTRIDNDGTAGDTVTFTATCQSFGIYSAAPGYEYDYVDIQIDGGDWLENKYISYNGVQFDVAYGAHTIVLRVRAGDALRIDEFWAI